MLRTTVRSRYVDTSLGDEWKRYGEGEWVTTAPKLSGTYELADREGNRAGQMKIICEGRKSVGYLGRVHGCPEQIWKGWWWSRPLPSLPDPPFWVDNDTSLLSKDAHNRR